jgi:hypothetical protein
LPAGWTDYPPVRCADLRFARSACLAGEQPGRPSGKVAALARVAVAVFAVVQFALALVLTAPHHGIGHPVAAVRAVLLYALGRRAPRGRAEAGMVAG